MDAVLKSLERVRFAVLDRSWHAALVELFTATFTESAGAAEGEQLQRLVDGLALRIDDEEVACLGALDGDRLVAAIFVTALRFEHRIGAWLLAPVAVASDQQRKGLGQALIGHGLDWLRAQGVDLVITYGDPAYYGKAGFRPLSEALIQAPLPLSQPHGWLGQSLGSSPIRPNPVRPTCVAEFNDPVYW